MPTNTAPTFVLTHPGATPGKLIVPVGSGDDQGRSLTQQADGKLVLGGASWNGSNIDFSLIRLNPDGSLDSTFDGDGKLLVPLGSHSDIGYSLTQQADGRLVLGGASYNGHDWDFSLIRLNTNGSLDSTFGSDGKLIVPVGSSDDEGVSLIQQADGKLVLGGTSTSGISWFGSLNSNFRLIRLNPDGSLDSTFDGDGVLLVPLGDYDASTGWSLTQQADGKLVLGGYSLGVASYDFSLIRLNPDGSLDSTFDGDGKLLVDLGGHDDFGRSLTLQTDGKLVLGGYSHNGSNDDFSLIRLNPDGSLDSTFDGDGRLIVPVGSGNDQGVSLTQQADGQLVLAGTSSSGSSDHFSLIRLNPNGSLDSTFDGDGRLLVPMGSDAGASLTRQADGQLVLGGTSYSGSDYNFSLIRLNIDGSLDTGFNPASINTLGATAAYTENAAPVALDSSVAIFDAELAALHAGAGNYSGASLSLARHGGASAQDLPGLSAAGALFTVSGASLQVGGLTFATFSSTGGTLDISFTGSGAVPTQALVNDVLSRLTYASRSDAPPGSVVMDYRFSDGHSGGALSTTGSVTVNITAVNDAPTLSGVPATAQVVSVGAAAALADFTVADVDGDTLTLTLTPINGTVNGLTDANPGAAGLQLTGSAASINAAVAAATFTASAAGGASIGLSLSDARAPAVTGSYNFVTAGDTTAPTVLNFSPADEATGVDVDRNVVLTFSEPIQRGSGTVYLETVTGVAIQSFDAATSTRLNLSGATLTLDPPASLDGGIDYRVRFSAGTVRDLSGNAYAGTSTYNFATVPTISVDTGGGYNFTNFDSFAATGDAIASIAVGSSTGGEIQTANGRDWFSVSLSAGQTYRFGLNAAATGGLSDPYLALYNSSGRLLAVDDDSAGHHNALLDYSATATGTCYLEVRAASTELGAYTLSAGLTPPPDTTAPTVLSFSPADEALGVDVDRNVVLTFSEPIQRGTGNIVLKTASGVTMATYDAATSPSLSLSGASLTINPSVNLAWGAGYSLEFAPGAVKDLAGNAYAGTSSYNFRTQAWYFVGETFTGTAGADTLTGGMGGDTLMGLGGNDRMDGRIGDDQMDGGAGLDFALYTSGFHSNFNISPTSVGWSVSGPAGTDSLVNIERLQFLDAHLAFDVDASAGQIYRLYKAAFARTPDLAGLGGWIAAMDSGGTSLTQVAQSFIGSAEFQNLYGASPGNAQFVTALYLNVFGRAPDSGGFNYWVNQLASGWQTRAQALATFSETAENKAATAPLTANGILYADSQQAASMQGLSWVGTAEADTVNGRVGNDTFTGGAGHDMLNGGEGIDLALYAGSRASHTLTVSPRTDGGVADLTVSSALNGSDSLSHIERVQFDDIALAFDLNGHAGQTYRLYQAAFDRTPDIAGLSDWIRGMDAGMSLRTVASGFIGSVEFQNLYGAHPTPTAFVDRLYANILHRAPDQSGYDHWLGQMQGGMTRELVLIGFSESVENQTPLLPVIQNGISYLPG